MPTTLVIPKHIGFILDGNRRFAKARAMMPWRGHEFGKEKVHEILDWCEEFGVKEVTLYTFSMQNFARPSREVEKLMELIAESFNELAVDPKVHERKMRVRAIGQIDLLPPKVREAIAKAAKATSHYRGRTLNICVAYGGKEEIFEAAKIIAKKIAKKLMKVKDLTLEAFESHLMLSGQPDLIIRTGGEYRTSNFLTWQSGYSEWFFVDKLLPEFEREDLIKVLKEFNRRERRFGK